MDNLNNDARSEDINIDEWIVVNSPGGRYLGKMAAGMTPEKVITAISEGDCLCLAPAFDFLAPLRPVQQADGRVGMQRDPIVAPIDFTLHDTPVHVKASSAYFCAEMKESDKKTYKDLVRGGLQSALHARAQQSGLHIAGPGPKGMIPRG